MSFKLLKYFLIAVFLSSFSFAQKKIVYKDFHQINLEDLNTEGPVGKLMMKAHLNINIDSTVYYIKKAEKLANTSKNTLLIPYINYHLGYAYYNKQEYSIAEKYLEKCLEFGHKFNLKGMLYESYNLLGVIYKHQTNFNLAIDYYKKSLNFAPTLIDSLQLKINISGIYIDTNKPDLGTIYLDEVFEFNNNHPNTLDPYWLVYANLNKSKVVDGFNNKFISINKAISNAKLTEDLHLLLQTNILLSELYLEFNKYPETLVLSKQNKKLAQQYNLNDLEDRILLILAKANFSLKNYKKSMMYIDSIKSNNNPEWLKIQVNQITFDNFVELGDAKNAVKIAKMQMAYLDSLLSIKENKAYAEYTKKYQTEKKIQENNILKKDNLIKDLVVSKQNRIRNYLILLVFIEALFLIFIFYRFRIKQKVAKELAFQNSIINNQKLTLEHINGELEKSNALKEKILAIISHDLINPFNSVLGFSNMLETEFDLLSDTEKKEYITIVNKGSKYNYNLVKNLLDWSKLQFNKVKINKSTINIRNMVNEAIKPLQLIADNKQISITNSIGKNNFYVLDLQLSNTILNNLVSNAIKYSYVGGEILIYLKDSKNSFSICIEDFGVGISKEEINNSIYNNQTVKSKVGTQNEKGTGLGLQICKEFMELQNGTLNFNVKETKGTIAILQFKIE